MKNEINLFEIAERPKTITIQRLTKQNKWVDVMKLHKNDGFSFIDAWNTLSCARKFKGNQEFGNYRVLNGANWQLFTTKNMSFFCRELLICASKNNKVFSVKPISAPENTAILMDLNDFLKWFRVSSKEHKGVAKTSAVPLSEVDNNRIWYKMTFEDGTVYSIAVYTSNGAHSIYNS